MILYEVYQGVVTVISVAKETPSGWRQHNNGFINRRVLKQYTCLDYAYYTTDMDEAIKWSHQITDHMHDLLQVSMASLSDLYFWCDELNCEESSVPKPRR